MVQLRRDNADGTVYNLVGFQTHLRFPEQRRVFSMIPALHDAEFLRYGVMHRNTFLNSPRLLDRYYRLKAEPRISFAGQMTGVEGYVESAASGFLVGVETARRLPGKPPVDFPQETAIGALGLYVSNQSVTVFQPMNINFGIMPPLDHRVKGKRNKNAELSQRSLAIIDEIERGGPCMKIIVDAMGGDNAPGAIVQGALEANRTHGLEILLVGRTAEILRAVEACGEKTLPAGVEIKGATEVVEIADDPATAFKLKKDSSLTVGLNLLKDGAGDAFVSAGSTGALLSGATLVVKRIRGIRRAAMGPQFPPPGDGRFSATAAPTPSARRSTCCSLRIWAATTPSGSWASSKPRVGLLNIGAEEEKGDDPAP